MKVFAISDFHLSGNNPKPMNIFGKVWDNYVEEIFSSWHSLVCEEDIVLIPGDISWAMFSQDALQDLLLIGGQKGRKVILRGNHDYWWKSIGSVRKMLPEGMYAVQNDSILLGDILICGTRGWEIPEYNAKQSEEDAKISARELQRLKLSLNDMDRKRKAEHKVVVMMHYPPFDSKYRPSAFTQMIASYQVDAVVYGHLHGQNRGYKRLHEMDGLSYYLTSCDVLHNNLVRIL